MQTGTVTETGALHISGTAELPTAALALLTGHSV